MMRLEEAGADTASRRLNAITLKSYAMIYAMKSGLRRVVAFNLSEVMYVDYVAFVTLD